MKKATNFREKSMTFIHASARRLLSVAVSLSLLLSILSGSFITAQAAGEFASGSGTAGDPYIITTEDQLFNLNNYLGYANRNLHFKLGNDIVMAGQWKPIGKFTYDRGEANQTAFTGTLDGAGHIIQGLTVQAAMLNGGLFAMLDGATIRDLGVTDASVSIFGSAGAITSYASNTTFINCFATGFVNIVNVVLSQPGVGLWSGGLTGSGFSNTYRDCYYNGKVKGGQFIGGISGFERSSSLIGCSAEINVGADSNYAGGLVGYMTVGTISGGFVSGTVEGSRDVGGAVGGLESNSAISNVMSETNVNATDANAGGIVGLSTPDSVVRRCYASMRVETDSNAGGINGSGGQVEYCLSTAKVTAKSNLGGIIGGKDPKKMEKCYFSSDGCKVSAESGTQSRTDDQLMLDGTYSEWTGGELSQNWDKATDFYPIPKNSFCRAGFMGAGTEKDPYRISHPFQLYALRNAKGFQYRNLHFLVDRDIDLSSFIAESSVVDHERGWYGIGYAVDSDGERLQIKFDGGNHIISGLWAKATDVEYVGLFRGLYNTTIKNVRLKLDDRGMTGKEFVGGLAGALINTTAENCHLISGKVSGSRYVGGLFSAVNDSDVINCSSAATVEADQIGGYSEVGGLVGQFTGPGKTMRDCWYEGTGVKGAADDVGGLIGTFYAGTVENSSVRRSSITGRAQVGGLIGRVDESTRSGGSGDERNVTGCYSAGTVNANSDVGGLIGVVMVIATVKGCSSSAEVHVTKTEESKQAGSFAGGLIGTMKKGDVLYCHATGKVIGHLENAQGVKTETGVQAIGGLIGQHQGTSASRIFQSYATGDVEGNTDVGGLIGDTRNNTIDSCFATGNVLAVSQAGGLAGLAVDDVIKKSYAAGDVLNNHTAGGLVSRSMSSVYEDCYALGKVSAERVTERGDIGYSPGNSVSAAGLIGHVDTGTFSLTRCYAAGQVTKSEHHYGGLIGRMMITDSTKFFTDCFYNKDNIGRAIGSIGSSGASGDSTYGGVSGKSLNDLKKLETFAVWGTSIINNNNTTSDSRYYAPTTGAFPALRVMRMERGGGFHDNDTAKISSPVEFDRLHAFTGQAYGGMRFDLENDIDVSGIAPPRSSAWIPIGDSSSPFCAKLDGKRFEVTGLRNFKGYSSALGLFGVLSGTVENLGVVTDTDIDGGFAGESSVGILAGTINGANVSGCYTKGEAYGTGSSRVGGFAGEMLGGSVTDCYTEALVGVSSTGGGFIGRTSGISTISNSYAATRYDASTKSRYGFTNSNSSTTTIKDCYYDSSLAGAGALDTLGATAKTTADMYQMNTFVGWDFGKTWGIDEGRDYPRLYGYSSLDGMGSLGNPYLIKNAQQLNALRGFVGPAYKDTYFQIANDIDLTDYLVGSGRGDGKGWMPIGGVENDKQFYGRLDGNGKEVRGLWINRGSDDYVGLFAYLRNDPDVISVKNLKITVDNDKGGIQGGNNTGALAGRLYNSTIDGIRVGSKRNTEGARITGSQYVGGLAGYIERGKLTGTTRYNEAYVEVSASDNAGGLIGRLCNGSTADFGLARGTVRADTKAGGAIGALDYGDPSSASRLGSFCAVSAVTNTGGLIGYLNNGVSLSQSFATGDVTGRTEGGAMAENTGGLVGTAGTSTAITDCSATGAVRGYKYVGGLNGRTWGMTVKDSYAAGPVSGNSEVNGLSNSNGTYTKSYYDTQTTGRSGGAGTKTTTDELIAAAKSNWKSGNWMLSSNSSYPYLRWQDHAALMDLSTDYALQDGVLHYNKNVSVEDEEEQAETGSKPLDGTRLKQDIILSGEGTSARLSASPAAGGSVTLIDPPALTNVGKSYRATVLSRSQRGITWPFQINVTRTLALKSLDISGATEIDILENPHKFTLSHTPSEVDVDYSCEVTPAGNYTILPSSDPSHPEEFFFTPEEQGTFTITFTATNKADPDDKISKSLDVTVTKGKKPGAPVDAPTLAGRTNTSLRIKPVTHPSNGQDVEYTVSASSTPPASGWRKENVSLTFGGLKEYTQYYIFARSAANDEYMTGTPSKRAVYTMDATAPTAEIQYKANGFKPFTDTGSFDLFFKKDVDVKIKAADTGSGVKTIEYYKAEQKVANPGEITDWILGSDFSVKQNEKFILYVRVTDVEGNTAVYSDGMVVYTDSEQDTQKIAYSKTDQKDVTAEVILNGNTIDSVENGAYTLIPGEHYTVSDNVITFKTTYLDTLANGTYQLTVHYKPLGESYVSDGNNEAPATTTLTLNVEQASLGLCITGLGSNYTYGCQDFKLSTSGGLGSGAVTYTSSDPDVASINGDMVTIHKAGTFTVTAEKAGDGVYAKDSVRSGTVTVHEATPTVLVSGNNIATPGQGTELTIKVIGVAGRIPEGEVILKEGDVTLDNLTLSADGEATYTILSATAGTHHYTAEYSGQAGYYTTATGTKEIGVGKSDQKKLTIVNPGVKVYGEAEFTLSADGGDGTGRTLFTVPNNEVISITDDGRVTIRNAGTVKVTAVKAGDNTYNAAEDTFELTINRRDISLVSVDVTGSTVYTGSQLQPVFTVSDSGLAIDPGDYTNTYGENITVAKGGSVTLTGQRNYTGSKEVPFDIDKADQLPIAIDQADMILDLSETNDVILTAKGGSGDGAVTWSSKDSRIASIGNDGKLTPAKIGTVTITVTKAADGNHTGPVDASITVTVVDKTDLKSLIDTAKNAKAGAVEGSGDGQYPASAITALQDAIDVAQLVVDNADASQQTIDDAYEALNAALTAFYAARISVDRTELEKVIKEAETILKEADIGDQPGQYPKNAADQLQKAIDAAKKTDLDPNASQADIDKAKNDLLDAIKHFLDSKLPLADPSKPSGPSTPQTGDSFPGWLIWTAAASLCGFSLALVSRKRRMSSK